jgi:tellurite resistance protein
MIKYRRLKTEKQDNLETISTLKADVAEYKRQMRFEQTTAQAVESGLLNKAQVLEEYVRVSYVVTAADGILGK